MIAFAATVWRILIADQTTAPLAPARAPEGRFHHDGQSAIYTSLTAEGAEVALKRYLVANEQPRMIAPFRLVAKQVLDLRVDPAERGNDIPATSIIWQEQRAKGLSASTWEISDAARERGAQGLLYSSRSRPDLGHFVLFDLTDPHLLIQAAPFVPWP